MLPAGYTANAGHIGFLDNFLSGKRDAVFKKIGCHCRPFVCHACRFATGPAWTGAQAGCRGVSRVRKTPGSPEKNDDTPVQWSNIKESFYPYTLNSACCPHVLEPLVLLFIVSAIDFESDSVPLSFCVFNKKQLHQVQIRKAGVQRLKIDYLEKVAESEVRRKRKIEAVKFSINTRSLAGKEKKTEPFSFLGKKGDFDIYLDKIVKIPVQVCGHIPGFGEVKIRLQKIEFSK